MLSGKTSGVRYIKQIGIIVSCLVCLVSVSPAKDGELKTSPLAIAFGSHPTFMSLSLSPDGDKMAFIQYHPDGFYFVRILDITTKELSGVIMSSPKDGRTEISRCIWANNKRLLCTERKRFTRRGVYFHLYRMIGVNCDGKDMKPLGGMVIDSLPDDLNHVLVYLEARDIRQRYVERKTRVGSLNINTGKIVNLSGLRSNAVQWISDGHGVPQLYRSINYSYRRWYVRKPKGDAVFWEILHEVKADDLTDSFDPVGFTDNPGELLYYDLQDGRKALFSMDLAHDRSTHLIFAHDRLDIEGVKTMGKYNRAVAVTYIDDKFRYYFFDKDVQRIYELITQLFPNHNVGIIDEDWNRRYYLVATSSDVEPTEYYRYDSNKLELMRIASISTNLANRKLAVMKEITYPASDKVSVPAFLTLPDGEKKTVLPAVILPHGGPSSRDIWDFDILAQFLAANGYVVLQSNYRGSSGYGTAWEGDGAFRDWKTAINDVNDGAKYLIDQGIADPNRICIVGWSYGGYAALLGAIENPSLYQCIVSIAGVTDPRKFGLTMLKFVGGKAAKEFIGADEFGDAGSPLKRAGEIKVPVLLAHAKEDANVPFKQSETMYKELMKKNKSVEFIQYEQAEHDIRPDKYRIDLFTRLAEFLDKHTK